MFKATDVEVFRDALSEDPKFLDQIAWGVGEVIVWQGCYPPTNSEAAARARRDGLKSYTWAAVHLGGNRWAVTGRGEKYLTGSEALLDVIVGDPMSQYHLLGVTVMAVRGPFVIDSWSLPDAPDVPEPSRAEEAETLEWTGDAVPPPVYELEPEADSITIHYNQHPFGAWQVGAERFRGSQW